MSAFMCLIVGRRTAAVLERIRHVHENRRIDPTERAHLRHAAGYRPPIHRSAPTPELADLVRRYWMPVWALPEGTRSVQRVLQYPVCLLVVSHEYALLVGPSSGLSTQELTGEGWALGTMLQPAAGSLVWGDSVDTLTDRAVPLTDARGLDGAALVAAIRDAVGADPVAADGQQRAVTAVEAALSPLLPVDEEGLLVNAVVEHVEGDSGVQRVGQVCEKFAIGERTLQWLIQRRGLHEAADRLAGEERPDLARVAADLGYADQAHFGRDFRTVTGLTPGEYA